MNQSSLPPCDVVIAPNRAVYINGTLVTNLTDFDFNYGSNAPIPEITLTFTPTSMVFGDVPNETIESLAFEQHPDDGTVNISRAIARAQARAAGLDPNRHVRPAPTPASAPVPVRKPVMEKKSVVEDEYPMDEEAPMAVDEKRCGEHVPGENSYVTCKKSYGHSGAHSRYKGKS